MPKLPRLTAREICSILEKLGFSIARQSGSHRIYKNAEGKRATVPFSCRESPTPQGPEKHNAGCGPQCRRPRKTSLTIAPGGSASSQWLPFHPIFVTTLRV